MKKRVKIRLVTVKKFFVNGTAADFKDKTQNTSYSIEIPEKVGTLDASHSNGLGPKGINLEILICSGCAAKLLIENNLHLHGLPDIGE